MTNNEEDPQLEDLIERVVCGDLEVDCPEVRAAIDAHPDFQTRLDAMLDLQLVLANDAGEMNSVLAEVTQPAQTPVLPGPWHKRYPIGLIAAAAVLVIAALPFLIGGESQFRYPNQGQMLSGPGAGVGSAATTPVGESSSFEVFRYVSPTLPANETRLQIRIWAAGASLLDTPLLELPIFEGTECTLTETQAAALPDAIQWRADVWNMSDKAVGHSDLLHASR